MFCHKCGTQIADGAKFCQKCGARVMTDVAEQQQGKVFGQQVQQGKVPTEAAKKKKSKKLPIILGIIVVVAVVFALSLSGEDEIDYVATVRAYTPFANSQGMPYTCGEVFDKYISDAEWSVRKSDDTSSYVDINGTATGTDKKLTVTIKVSENSQDSDTVSFSPVSAAVNGRELPDKDNVTTFLLTLFTAYDGKYGDMSDFGELLGQIEDGLIAQEVDSQGDSDSMSGKIEVGETKSYDSNSFGDIEVSEEVRRQAMDYVGEWGDTISQRCMMSIAAGSQGEYLIEINWSSSASENTRWSFVGTFDSESGAMVYSGSRTEELYTDGGDVQTVDVYTDGTGSLFIGGAGILYWDDYEENAGKDCVFEKL